MKSIYKLFLLGIPLLITIGVTYHLVTETGKKTLKRKVAERIYSETEVSEYIGKDALLNQGHYHYKVRCTDCHGFLGEGNSHGPALNKIPNPSSTETFNRIYHVISTGRKGTTMPAWGKSLREDDLIAITSYILSLSQ